jgi:hypothetical protein
LPEVPCFHQKEAPISNKKFLSVPLVETQLYVLLTQDLGSLFMALIILSVAELEFTTQSSTNSAVHALL